MLSEPYGMASGRICSDIFTVGLDSSKMVSLMVARNDLTSGRFQSYLSAKLRGVLLGHQPQTKLEGAP